MRPCSLALFASAATGLVERRSSIEPRQRPAHHAELQGRGHRPDHRGGRAGHRQDLHPRPARARAGHDALADADVAGCVLRGVPLDPAGARLRGGASPATSSRSCRTPTPGRCPAIDLPDRVSATSDELVTQVIAVKNVQRRAARADAAPAHAAVGAHGRLSRRNILIISDRAAT